MFDYKEIVQSDADRVKNHALSGCALTRADFGSDDYHDETTCSDGGTYWDHAE